MRDIAATQEPLVLVPANVLDDLLELARLASDRLGDEPLSNALKGSAAEVRCRILLEP